MLEMLIVIAALALTIAIQTEHKARLDSEKRALSTVVFQKQRARSHSSLRRLYNNALKADRQKELHDWLNQIDGDIKVGHIWLVRQYVLNRKDLPYPVPAFC